jgi:hypothetical protein
MELREFVTTALTDIVAGVAAARVAVADHGAVVGSDPVYGYVKEAKVLTDGQGRRVSEVEFDIALARTDATGTKGGIGVLLGAVNLGSKGESRAENVNTSRIKFTVPIVLPGDKRARD